MKTMIQSNILYWYMAQLPTCVLMLCGSLCLCVDKKCVVGVNVGTEWAESIECVRDERTAK